MGPATETVKSERRMLSHHGPLAIETAVIPAPLIGQRHLEIRLSETAILRHSVRSGFWVILLEKSDPKYSNT